MPRIERPLEDAGFNQSPIYEGVDLYLSDAPLRRAMAVAGVDEAAAKLSECGRSWGSAQALDEGRIANEKPPALRQVDPKGFRIDRVEFHPAYHALMSRSVAQGIHASAFAPGATARDFIARGARLYMAVQAEAGHMCPITMTHAVTPALAAAPDIAARWAPKIHSRVYDPSQRPWWEKSGVTFGMGMTERQGGTDVRANISRAEKVDDHYEITGHKWFMSAPMCDAFLVLAQARGGLTCFLIPRHRPDGQLNALRFQRLKDKLGNRSNASSEVEFLAAYAERVGEEGRGVPTIIGMVNMTRLDCAMSSAGLMRWGLANALHHTRHRSVFQRHLADQPMMRAVIADVALEVEAMTALSFRLARAIAASASDPNEAAYARLMTPAIKYLVCKTAPALIYETMECLGGNGYVEELPLARLYREAPLNAIWEGSGNVMALDVLRAAQRSPEAARATINAVAPGKAGEAIAARLMGRDAERNGRIVTEALARRAAVAALAEYDEGLAALYAATRIDGPAHAMFGACDLDGREAMLMERALPH
jgi:putative acyl-CoA dehydrogenase